MFSSVAVSVILALTLVSSAATSPNTTGTGGDRPASADGAPSVALVRAPGTLPAASVAPQGPVDVQDISLPLAQARRVAPAATEGSQAPLEDKVVNPDAAAQLHDVASRRVVRQETTTLAGVTWDGPAPDQVELRSRQIDGDWSEWTPLEMAVGDGQEPRGTEPVWTGETKQVEVRAERDSRDVTAELRLVLIDPRETATDRTLAAAAPAEEGSAAAEVQEAAVKASPGATTPARPTVITRGQWGANESWVGGSPSYGSTVKAATVHHTAGSNSYTAEQSAGIVRGILKYHTQSLGWNDIGYNALVDKYGQIFEGRAGGLAFPVIGAHAGGFNTDTFGISMLGDFSSNAGVYPSAAALESVSQMIAYKLGGSYWGDPYSKVTLVSAGGTSRFPAGTPVALPRVFAHRDVGNTECPGDYGYTRMNAIRDRVAALSTDLRTPIWEYWTNASGGPAGPWGPVWQVEEPAPFGGRAAYFAGSGGVSISSHPVYGTWAVGSPLREGWLAAGGYTGIGYPVRASFQTGIRGGLAQEFSNGGSIVWSSKTGSRSLSGTVRDKWWRTGGLNGFGYPTRSQGPVGDGRGTFAEFENKASILSTATTGTVVIHGDVRDKWWQTGGINGLGYPSVDTGPVGDGRGTFAEFERGASILYTSKTGAHTLVGPLRTVWWQTGGASGALGYPVTDGINFPGGGGYNDFEGGQSIVWSQSTGAHVVWGAIRDKWRNYGGPDTLGFPTNDGVNFAGGRGGYSDFSKDASVVWGPSTGAHPVVGAIRAKWRQLGSDTSRLGLPTHDPETTGTGVRQQFQGGVLIWNRSTGVVTVG